MTDIEILPEDIDHIPGITLPRANEVLIGHEQAEQAFTLAFESGRLPHAWLIGGLEGIGKASLAFRLAKFVLASGASPDEKALIGRAVAQLSHPDLILIRRRLNEEKAEKKRDIRSEISVKDVRNALRRIASTSSKGGWRVVIVDSADDFNEACSNALLKTIEEPPPRVLFFILSHRPARVKVTLRSRCRRLMLHPLDEQQVDDVISKLMPAADMSARQRAAALSLGSPGRALRLLGSDGLTAVHEFHAILSTLQRSAPKDLIALSERLDRKGDEMSFPLFRDTVFGFIASEVRRLTVESTSLDAAARLAEASTRFEAAMSTGDIYNLPRRTTVLTELLHLRQVLIACATA